MNVKYYQKYIQRLIDLNPIDISIKRNEKIYDNYGNYDNKETIIKLTASLYDSRGRREVITDYGISYTGISITKLLTRHDADIRKGDTFVANGSTYEVFHVKEFKGICKQIELEVVGDGKEYSRLQELRT